MAFSSEGAHILAGEQLRLLRECPKRASREEGFGIGDGGDPQCEEFGIYPGSTGESLRYFK